MIDRIAIAILTVFVSFIVIFLASGHLSQEKRYRNFQNRGDTLLKTGEILLSVSEKNLEYANRLLEALPIDKLIEYSDKQDLILKKQWELSKLERTRKDREWKKTQAEWDEYIKKKNEEWDKQYKERQKLLE